MYVSYISNLKTVIALDNFLDRENFMYLYTRCNNHVISNAALQDVKQQSLSQVR